MNRTATSLEDRPRLVTDADIPELPPSCDSWIVTRNSDGKPVFEIYDRKWLKCLKADMVTIWTALAWLRHHNATEKPNVPRSIL